jgi:hypothetical protein
LGLSAAVFLKVSFGGRYRAPERLVESIAKIEWWAGIAWLTALGYAVARSAPALLG